MLPHDPQGTTSGPRPPIHPIWSRSFLAILLTCAVALGSCNDPQEPVAGQPDGYRAVYDPHQGVLEFELQSNDGGVSALRLVATNLSFDTDTREVHAWVALRNTGDADVPGPAVIGVLDFTPSDVRPLNADCPADTCESPAGTHCDGACFFDHRDTYGDDGVLGAGATSEPVEWVLLNPTGESFAFRARLGGTAPPGDGVISGVVFDDRNRNGARENDEPGIPGSTVVLVSGDAARTATTDARGRYAFGVVEPGLYEIVWRAIPDNCIPTTPQKLQVAILRRADGSLSSFERGDFGCLARPDFGVPVTGSVFLDSNRNGERDPGEAGVPGVLIVGTTPQCPTFAPIETRTDERGAYLLRLPDCVPPFVVHRAPPAGFVDTTPNPVVFESRPPDGNALIANFGVVPDETLPEFFVEGVVFLDGNRNGMRDPNEPGVEGVEMTADGLLCFSPISAHTRTDASGNYRLRGEDVRCPLPWLLRRHGPWIDTTTNPVFLTEPPPDGSNTFRVDFGVAPRDSVPPNRVQAIEGVVYADLDRNGMRSANEPGVAGVEVQLLSPCDILRATRTDERGRYHFPPDVVGVCPVTAVLQSAPMFSENTTPNPVPVDPAFPALVFVADFGVYQERTTP